MAQSGFTPISIYYSTTASAVPTAANLVPGELAINTNDGKLYYEDSSGVVQVLATKSTGSIGGSNTQVQFNNSGSLGGSSSFTWDGTTVTATKFAGALNGTVGATTASTGAFTTLTSNGATTFTAGTASTSTTTGTTVITGGLGVSGRINAANFDGIVGANTAAAGSFTTINASTSITNAGLTSGRVTFAGASGLLTDSANLTFSGTDLNLTSSAGAVRYTATGATAMALYADNNAGYIGTENNFPLVFQTNNAGRMWLNATGLGIGTSSPANALDIYSAPGDAYVKTQRSDQAGYGGRFGCADSIIGGSPARSGGVDGFNAVVFGIGGSGVARFDSSGNLLVGTTSTSFSSATRTVLALGSGANGSIIDFQVSGATSDGYIYYDGTNATIENSNAGYIRFNTNVTERMRIDSSGLLLVGTTTAFNAAYTMSLKVSGSTGGLIIQPGADNYTAIQFNNAAGTGVGSISVSSTLTTYNVSSDYRLKENITPMTGALATVAQLKPVTYKWKSDGSAGQGFIAHELQAVVPDCVTGEKDAVDENGKIKPQGVDTSFLVATLTAAIQELKAEFDAYKATHP